MGIPAGIVSADDYLRAAAERLPPSVWGHVASVGGDGRTREANRAAWNDIRLEGRVLADVAGGHTRLSLFGLDLAHPLLVAPTALHRLVHPEGEHATMLGAAAAGALMAVSCQASTRIEDLAARAQTPLWFQLYMQPRREDTLALLRRAEAAGMRALVVTVDAPANVIRNAGARAEFAAGGGVRAVNLDGFAAAPAAPEGASPVFEGLMRAAPGWADIAWLRAQTRLPLLLKGIMSRRDVAPALDCGIDGLIVSNHGGRVLDTLPATAEVLPGIVAEAAGLPVLVDGGIRRGTDILKARALGAAAVLTGLPVLAALAVGGAVGVNHVLRILLAELEVAMALTGCRSWDAIGPEVIFTGRAAANGA